MSKVRTSFEEVLLSRFPAAIELAANRIFTDYKKTFFDTRTRKPLYPIPVILAGLLIAQKVSSKSGFKLDLSEDEKRVLKKAFKIKV